jgi:hypothetical protein
MGNYATYADVTGFKVDGSAVDLSSYTEAEVGASIDRIEEFIEYICNDVFYAKTQTFLVDGNGSHKLFFAMTTPYRSVTLTSVKELDFDGTTIKETFVEDTDFKKYDYYLETARRYPGMGARTGVTRGGVWPKGQKNIEIIGTWGHSSTPADIKHCVILLVLERLKPGSTRMASKDVKQVVWSDFTVTFSGSSSEGDLTGFVDVDRILSKYVNMSTMFVVTPSEPFDRGMEL